MGAGSTDECGLSDRDHLQALQRNRAASVAAGAPLPRKDEAALPLPVSPLLCGSTAPMTGDHPFSLPGVKLEKLPVSNSLQELQPGPSPV